MWIQSSGLTRDTQQETEGQFVLEPTEATLAAWPHKFKLIYTVRLTLADLTTGLQVVNSDSSLFSFTALLHTYLRARQTIDDICVHGLKGLSFRDKTRDDQWLKEDHDAVVVRGEVDRAYKNVPNTIRLDGVGGEKGLELTLDNFCDLVVWNPWVDKSKAMSDFEVDGYKSMICVEAGSVCEEVTLKPGEVWKAQQTLKPLP